MAIVPKPAEDKEMPPKEVSIKEELKSPQASTIVKDRTSKTP